MPRATRIAQQGEQTREQILDAAVKLFGERGFRGTSLSQIAAQAGVVQSVLHHHFGSKDQLLTATLLRHYPPAAQRPDVEAIAAGQMEFFDEMLRVTRNNAAHPDLVRFFSVMTGEALTEGHPAQEFFVARYDNVREGFVSAIARSKGTTDPRIIEEISTVVSIFFAMSDGLQMQWLRNPSIDFVASVEIAVQMLRERLDSLIAPR
ncbi:TetR/AcrR family transcriptional regulator [Burkholderia lata]|uniref:TetR/AcrR family transcriptional regulator n=1 Tax=Burkholderia lata (strain ATCC 17760 / DSM 23089 / LMG 22485 / NCIMB 9086 / R18194 / 383) TaxID=482957 RepID=UPI0014535EF1|nr:TetR/AcrR family transcriptional regulator [Burkholderia lata]VWB87120.1 TetR family transcriptional regulator [Burkholderia lata]